MPESSPQGQIPTGHVEKREWTDSETYPGTTRNFWIYVSANYDAETPACLMVFQDGEAYLHEQGQVNAAQVMDTLIHIGEMPATIGIFINPGILSDTESSRPLEYVARGDTYARFLEQEIIKQIASEYAITDDPEGRCICGMSDGGLCAFSVAWERPDLFHKVITHIASYVRYIDGEMDLTHKVRATRRDPKPLRIFIQDGDNDLNIEEGNWTLGNIAMANALAYGRYDYRFELGTGGHELKHAGALFAETLRWIWRDYPGVVTEPNLAAVTGRWRVDANGFGMRSEGELTISLANDQLTATLRDDKEGDIKVSDVHFDGYRLGFDYKTPPSQKLWGKEISDHMTVWAALSDDGNGFEGFVSGVIGKETSYDHKIRGARIN